MFGMEMILKNLGLDPEKIQETITVMLNGVKDMNERLARVEQNQQALLDIIGAAVAEKLAETETAKQQETAMRLQAQTQKEDENV